MNIHEDGGERWVPIQGYEGLYEVSDHGRVRRMVRRHFSEVIQIPAPLALKPRNMGRYKGVCLAKDAGVKYLYLHRLVAQHFIGPAPTPKHDVAHEDGTRDNNHWANLRWKTRKENMADCVKHGTRLRGEAVGNSKLTEEDVREIRNTPGTQSTIAKRFGVTDGAIRHVLHGRSWRHVQ